MLSKYKLVFVSHRHKAAYLSIPKTGMSSVKRGLLRAWGLSDHPSLRGGGINESFDLLDRCDGFDILRVGQLSRLDSSYLRFAFVRNPFDRLVSCFANKISPVPVNDEYFEEGLQRGFRVPGKFWAGMPFDRFAGAAVTSSDDVYGDPHVASQCAVVCCGGRLNVDFVGRFERLAADWARICRMGRWHGELPKANVSNRRPYRDYFDDQTRQCVAKRYARDLRFFGYAF